MIASLTDEAPASKTKQPAVESISLLRFRPSPTQPRKLFRPEKLKELAESMSKHGFMRHHPILARVNRGTEAPPTLEIVEGERRWRAAKEAGLLEVWCVVEDLTDAQVIEHQLIENLQRDDLTDIEEAEGYQRMLELRDEASGELLYKTREALAERLGRPETTIREQLTLLNLGPAERKEVEGGRLKKQTAYLIARQPTPELREIAAKLIIWPKHEEGPLSYRRAVQEIEKLSKDLRRAPFDRNDASLVPEIFESGKQESRIRIGGGACADCPMAFVTEARSLCMNPQCYDAKVEAEWDIWALVQRLGALPGNPTDEPRNIRVLSRAECANLYKSDNQLVPAAGYVDLAEHPDGNDLRPGESDPGTWRTLIDGSKIEVAVVRDRLGRTRELVKREVALMAAVQNGFAVFRKSEGESQKSERPTRREIGIAVPAEIAPNESEQWLNAAASPDEVAADKKRLQQAREAERRLDELTLAEVIAEVGAKLHSPSGEIIAAFLRLIIEREIDFEAPHADLLQKHHLPVGSPVGKQIAQWDVARLVTFLVELFVTEGGYQVDVHADDQKWLRTIFGVDYGRLRAAAAKGESRKVEKPTCSRTHCKQPAEPGKKMCARCGEKVKLNQRQKRAEGRA